jgi:hypothetical protein
MSKREPLNDAEREELVAYLDGELDAHTARSMEVKLSEDPRYSAEAASLSKSWSMLDLLPPSEPTSNFTSRTLERVSALRPAATPSGGRRWPTWALAGGWAAMVVLAAGLGFAAVNRWTRAATPPKSDAPPVPPQVDEQLARRQWIDGLPRAYQEKLHQLESDPARYEKQLKAYQQEQQERQQDWQRAVENWDVMEKRRQQLVRLQPQIKTFVQESLWPLLTTQERARLKNAEPPPEGQGDWPHFLMVLVELSDKHPIWLPPSPMTGSTNFPTNFEELPAQLRARLKAAAGWPTEEARAAQGKWPDYPLTVWRFIVKKELVPRSLPGPSHLENYAPSVQKFCKDELFPRLTAIQKDRLHKAEGHWPAYPKLLLRLSAGKMPGMRLPGPPDFWKVFREQLVVDR